MRIYVCHPYTAPEGTSLHDAPRIVQHNVDHSIAAANRLIEMGHMPYVPVLSHYIHIHQSCKYNYGDWWYVYDLTFLELWAEAILVLGNSKGTRLEQEAAQAKGIPIYHSFKEVPKAEHVLYPDDIKVREITIER